MVTGIEIITAIDTRMKFSRRKVKTIAFSELPNIFLIPISLVLDRTTKRVRPNSPNADITMLRSAKIETMVLRFRSYAYRFSITSSIVACLKGLSGEIFFHSVCRYGRILPSFPGL